MLWIVAVNLFSGNAGYYAFPGIMILFSPAVQVFPMGLICGIHFDRLRKIGRWSWIAVATLAFLASFPLAELSATKLLMLGVVASCLILAIADVRIAWRHVVRRLGDASYGIYLLHFPAMLAAAQISAAGGLLWFVAVGLGCGFLFGLFDHTLYRWMVSMLHDWPRLYRTQFGLPPRPSS